MEHDYSPDVWSTSDDPTYEGYMNEVAVELAAHLEWRIGQTYFNVLSAHRPDLAEKVAGTSVDPFYDDRRLPAFHNYVMSAWPHR